MKPTPPEGYKLLDGFFDDELSVKRTDLAWDISNKCWRKPKIGRSDNQAFRSLGIVKNYFYVARREDICKQSSQN